MLISDCFPAVENEWTGTSPHHKTPLCWAGGCRSKHSAPYKRIQRSERKFNLREEVSSRRLYKAPFLIFNPDSENLRAVVLFYFGYWLLKETCDMAKTVVLPDLKMTVKRLDSFSWNDVWNIWIVWNLKDSSGMDLEKKWWFTIHS